MRPTLLAPLAALAATIALLVACGGGGGAPPPAPEPGGRSDSRPNIIIVFTDDQGHADIGAQGVDPHLRTPFIDSLATEGVRMTQAYVTGPQCTPSRGALMTGVYQQRYGLDDNRYTPLPTSQATLAERLAAAGYATGMVGKWHLELDENSADWWRRTYPERAGETYALDKVPFEVQRGFFPDRRGFQDVFFGTMNTYWANFDLQGQPREAGYVSDRRFRVDVVSDAAEAFVHRHARDPFFLYVAYFAPHVPLEAPDHYLARIPADLPLRRRTALAMLAAVDDGVGRLLAALRQHGIERDTLLVFMSDNGAPLGMTRLDAPLSDKAAPWNGSLNTPWVGEKGMLAEGGLRVPLLARWPGRIAPGQVFTEPVISLDVSATAAAAAGLGTAGLDGLDLLPALAGPGASPLPARALYWRFLDQAAIRKGDWKYLSVAGGGEYLFDLASPAHEQTNLAASHAGRVASLKAELAQWSAGLPRSGWPAGTPSSAEQAWYDFYFSGP